MRRTEAFAIARSALGAVGPNTVLGRLTLCLPRQRAYNTSMMVTRAICAIGLHRWRWEKTDDGEKYRHCRRCGKDDPSIPFIRSASGMDNLAWPR